MSEANETTPAPGAVVHQPREKRDGDDHAGKILDFLSESMLEEGIRRVMRVEIKCVSDGYRSEPLESWSREANPEFFGKLAHTESIVAKMTQLAEEYVDATGEACLFEVKTRAYDQSVRVRKIKVMPPRRPANDQSLLLPHETPTANGFLALVMRHNSDMMRMMEANQRNTAALQRGSVESVLQILKETREENAQLRAERRAHLAELESARSEESERDMKFSAQEELDKRRMILTNKVAMILPVLAHAIAKKLGDRFDKKPRGEPARHGAADGATEAKSAEDGVAPGAGPGAQGAPDGDGAKAKPPAKSPLELELVSFMSSLTDEQMQAIRGMLSVEQSILLGAALDAAESGGSPMLSTMVKDFVESFGATPEKFTAILEYLTADQRMQLLGISRIAKQAAQQ